VSVELSPEERDVLLAALFELWLTRATFDDEPNADQMPTPRISREAIEGLVAKLGGSPDTALFGAFRDEPSDDAAVPEYPADETDEG
jgi:hypothetical protein